MSASITINTDTVVGSWNYYRSTNTASAVVTFNDVNTFNVPNSDISLTFSGRSMRVDLRVDVGSSSISVNKVYVKVTLGSYTLYELTVNCSSAITVAGTTTISLTQNVS